jgi:hypothetical protein
MSVVRQCDGAHLIIRILGIPSRNAPVGHRNRHQRQEPSIFVEAESALLRNKRGDAKPRPYGSRRILTIVPEKRNFSLICSSSRAVCLAERNHLIVFSVFSIMMKNRY